jgi:hypothetical protein
MAEGKKTGGRQAGTPNKATNEARQAIALFVDANAHRLTGWLDEVANGVKVTEMTEEGPVDKYIVAPNPAKAFDMFQSVVEYHIPKLARTEIDANVNANLDADIHINVFGELLDNMLMQRQEE